MPLSQITASTGVALDLAMVKTQCRLSADASDEDDYLASVVTPAVVDRAEAATRRALPGGQIWDLVLDGFPRGYFVEIPKPPLVSVTYVRYVDTSGVTRTLTANTDYLVQAPAGPRCKRGRIALPFSTVWPVTLQQMGAVTIRFVAGYTDIPSLLVAGMLMDAGMLFENRESILTGLRAAAVPIPSGTQDIYETYRSYPTQRLAGLDEL
jgi:uncharacterized phiE125 gp8 family phage protein